MWCLGFLLGHHLEDPLPSWSSNYNNVDDHTNNSESDGHAQVPGVWCGHWASKVALETSSLLVLLETSTLTTL